MLYSSAASLSAALSCCGGLRACWRGGGGGGGVRQLDGRVAADARSRAQGLQPERKLWLRLSAHVCSIPRPSPRQPSVLQPSPPPPFPQPPSLQLPSGPLPSQLLPAAIDCWYVACPSRSTSVLNPAEPRGATPASPLACSASSASSLASAMTCCHVFVGSLGRVCGIAARLEIEGRGSPREGGEILHFIARTRSTL